MSCGQVAGTPLTPREAASALAMVTARTEPDYQVMAFQEKLVPLDISARSRLTDVVRKTEGLPFGGTDCALPMRVRDRAQARGRHLRRPDGQRDLGRRRSTRSRRCGRTASRAAWRRG